MCIKQRLRNGELLNLGGNDLRQIIADNLPQSVEAIEVTADFKDWLNLLLERPLMMMGNESKIIGFWRTIMECEDKVGYHDITAECFGLLFEVLKNGRIVEFIRLEKHPRGFDQDFLDLVADYDYLGERAIDNHLIDVVEYYTQWLPKFADRYPGIWKAGYNSLVSQPYDYLKLLSDYYKAQMDKKKK